MSDDKLLEKALLARAAPGDRLMLADAVLLAALDGSRPLAPAERRALQASPLTLRRFRHLSLQRHAAGPAATAAARATLATSTSVAVPAADAAQGAPDTSATSAAARPQAANDAQWAGSMGMLRAAAGMAELDELVTDDGCWALHFVPEAGRGWQLVLKLEPAAPFAARLLRERPLLRVVDGGGAILLQGRLDEDGECERPWPFELAPMAHFQLYGATFAIEPCR